MTEKVIAEAQLAGPQTGSKPVRAATALPDLAAAEITDAASPVEPEPERVLLHMPVDIRSMSLVVLAMFASLFVLHWAKAVLIPLMLGVLFSYALSPVVNWLELRCVPRWLGAAVLLLSIFGVMGSTAYSLKDEALQLVESLPTAAQKFRQAVKNRTGKTDSALDTVQKAASQIQQAAQESAPAAVSPRGAMRVVLEPSRFNVNDYLWTGTIGLIALIGQATVVVFLTYFLMLSGDAFRRKLLKLAGPRLSDKKITLQALHEITDQIQRYLQVQLLTSALVGVLTWLALLAIGLDNAAVWGIVAAVLNLVPYVGSLATAAASGAGRLSAVWLAQHGAAGGRRLPGHPYPGRQPADPVAHQPRQPHEPGGGVCRAAGLGLALGCVGPVAGYPDSDDC